MDGARSEKARCPRWAWADPFLWVGQLAGWVRSGLTWFVVQIRKVAATELQFSVGVWRRQRAIVELRLFRLVGQRSREKAPSWSERGNLVLPPL